jgi:8-oxo-dGTP diphosphatase
MYAGRVCPGHRAVLALSSVGMAGGDGNGWAECGQRHRHWGTHGAAGLLVYARDQAGQPCVLLLCRASWTQHGGTWAPPGGARDSHESAVAAALREAAEECGVPPGAIRIQGILRDDHGGWSHETVIGGAPTTFPVRAASREATKAAWVPVADVGSLPLHPGFAHTWPVLRDALEPVTVIVDGANVMGARADGWWRDRAGAAVRLHDELAGLSARGVPSLPDGTTGAALDRWFPRLVLVVEGAARAAADRLAARSASEAHRGQARPGDPESGDPESGDGVLVAIAPGSGDDTIAALAAETEGRRLVVTADRELRRRCERAGAAVTGPRWLLGLL